MLQFSTLALLHVFFSFHVPLQRKPSDDKILTDKRFLLHCPLLSLWTTAAAEWENQLSESVKQDRLSRINVKNAEAAAIRSQRYLGRMEEVLVEDVNDKHSAQVRHHRRTLLENIHFSNPSFSFFLLLNTEVI